MESKNLISHGITLGSLFDGIGGFPYAASFFGIKTLWASEIMPQAISVTRRHLPEMDHVGDITMLDGAKLPPVDIITFGSPCQDLSVAGKRAGLGGHRSGLFAEAIRIIDEMRRETDGRYPRYAVWENVPGALSSGNPRGSDFCAVLEAFAKTKIPTPASGRWANAGMVRGGGVDLAWCVYNAQHFGVPQRRRRIFLVCDFGGGSAGEILFVPKSLSGYFAARRAQGQSLAINAVRGPSGASVSINTTDNAKDQMAFACNQRDEVRDLHDLSAAVCAQPGMKQQTFLAKNCLTPWDVQSRRIHADDGAWPTLCGEDGGGHGYAAVNCLNPWDAQQSRVFVPDDGLSPTLAGADGGGGRNPGGLVYCSASSHSNAGITEELAGTLTCQHEQAYICEPKLARTLTARGDGSPNVDSGPNIIAVGVHQNQNGDVNTSETAYTLNTNGNATGRNAPIVAHASGLTAKGDGDCFISPEYHNALTCGGGMPGQGYPAALVAHPSVCGTLVASGAGLSRPAGLASETDLCVVVPEPGPIPINDKATRYKGGGGTRNGDGAGNGLGVGKSGDPAPTITSGDRHAVAAYCLQGNMIGRQDHNGPMGGGVKEGISFTLTSTDIAAVASVDCRNCGETEELSGTLQAKTQGYSLNYQDPVRSGYIVRRLLPVECERLMGYPDGWTETGYDGMIISDTRRYQMLGNSIAVPCVAYIMLGIAEQIKKEEVDGKIIRE